MLFHMPEVTSVANLVEVAKTALVTFQAAVWFRGQESSDWGLLPGVFRPKNPGKPNDEDRVRKRETRLLFRFKDSARALSPHCPLADRDLGHWLPFARHHGLPTRLLDWTESILVAAFFALQDIHGSKGASLWALAPGILNKSQLNGDAHTILLSGSPELEQMLPGMMGPAPEVAQALAVKLPETFVRMTVQRTVYTIHAPLVDLKQIDGHEDFLLEFRIPADKKEDVWRGLTLLGITRSTLFPDLDNLARDLSEHHW